MDYSFEETVAQACEQAEYFLRIVTEKFPGTALHLQTEVGLVLARCQDFAQSCEAGVSVGDRDADGFVCVRVDPPSDCNGGRIVWHRRWNDDASEKLAEFVRIHLETGESWDEFCETWDLAQEEALLHPEPFPKQLYEILGLNRQ